VVARRSGKAHAHVGLKLSKSDTLGLLGAKLHMSLNSVYIHDVASVYVMNFCLFNKELTRLQKIAHDSSCFMSTTKTANPNLPIYRKIRLIESNAK
jgi:hypothetical protein